MRLSSLVRLSTAVSPDLLVGGLLTLPVSVGDVVPGCRLNGFQRLWDIRVVGEGTLLPVDHQELEQFLRYNGYMCKRIFPGDFVETVHGQFQRR